MAMLDTIRREPRSAAAQNKRKTMIEAAEKRSESEGPENVRTQWTVKGIDKRTLDLSRLAARKRGMTFGAWVNEVLRDAASEEDSSSTNATKELMTRIAEIELKLGQSVDDLKQQTSHIQHDVRVLHMLVPNIAKP